MTTAPAMITQPRLMMIGGGASGQVADVMGKIGVQRPLIVTDGFMRDSGMLARITDVLDESGIVWQAFADTVPDPTTEVIDTGAALLNDGDFDSMIALGGGSPMDTAKAMGVLATHGGIMRDYKVPTQVDRTDYPLIAIPTTAGGKTMGRSTISSTQCSRPPEERANHHASGVPRTKTTARLKSVVRALSHKAGANNG